MKVPRECPVVLCQECGDTVVALTGEIEVFTAGVDNYAGESCVEYIGTDEYGGFHGALNPLPLTPFAKEMLIALGWNE